MHKLEIMSIKNVENIVVNKQNPKHSQAKVSIGRKQHQSEDDSSIIIAHMTFEMFFTDEDHLETLSKTLYIKTELRATIKSLTEYEDFDEDELLGEITMILFPYLRNHVSAITASVGLKAFELPFSLAYGDAPDES